MKFIFLVVAMSGIFTSCVSKPNNPLGGYNYPNWNLTVIDTNEYYFPIRDLISTKDSFNSAYYEKFWHEAYGEANLSLKPIGPDIFRLTFKSAFRDAAIITVLEDKIISKQWIKGDPYPEIDSTRFTPLEKHLYELLYWNFPIQKLSGRRRQRLDSIAKVYPQLLDPFYYRRLLDKALVPNKDQLVYKTREVKITKTVYYKLLKHINESGYWNMKYEEDCEGYEILDGYSIFLEANTSHRYNIVTRFGCPLDDPKFAEACQEIIYAAKLARPLDILSRNNSR